MTDTTTAAPAITGVHHFSPTVTDVEKSAAWYEQVFGMTRVPVPFPHWENEDSGFATLLMDPRSGIAIGLHVHKTNGGEKCEEHRTGLDHIGFGVGSRAELDAWVTWLDGIGVEHSGVNDCPSPIPYSTLVFRDPDNIQLEIFFMAS